MDKKHGASKAFGKDLGLVHEMMVTGKKAGAGRDFYSALAHNEALFARTVAFVSQGGYLAGYNPDKFHLVKEFNLTIPKDYIHATRLDTFKATLDYADAITDENFKNVSHHLVPGKTYKVKIFGDNGKAMPASASHDELLDVYRSNNAYFTGAHGASVVYEYAKHELIEVKSAFYFSFDEKRGLPMSSNGFHSVPCIKVWSDAASSFDLATFENIAFNVFDDVGGGLILFCDCDE